jgi:hypothetical protein
MFSSLLACLTFGIFTKKLSGPIFGPSLPTVNWLPGFFFPPEVKHPSRTGDRSPSSSAKNEWSYTCVSPYMPSRIGQGNLYVVYVSWFEKYLMLPSAHCPFLTYCEWSRKLNVFC